MSWNREGEKENTILKLYICSKNNVLNENGISCWVSGTTSGV